MANGIRAQDASPELTAYWTFDQGYTSEVNNSIFEGIPYGGEFNSITNAEGEFVRGSGSLKLDSGPQSGDTNYVDIPNPIFPYGHDTVSIVSWYRYEDIGGDEEHRRLGINPAERYCLYGSFG